MTHKKDTLKKVTILWVFCVLIRILEKERDKAVGNLNRTLFTEDIIRRLEKNPNVQRVSETNISYTAEFKLAAVKAYNEGTPPSEIFLRAGFDLDLIGSKKPKHSLKRWRDSFAKYGELGLLEERRGKGSAGRKPASPLSADEELKRAKAKIKLLEAEVDFLKKLEALERNKGRP
ncbi:HTH domain-containing protein [Paenibacillus sp. FSL H7-0350]|uniref:HTH domain-containing protein n=1 Tax=Paenibacillus sp. FSL H7-0350 TaxID=2975345 RepID=UPI0003E292DA|nr:transposase for insertion sequence element IS3 family protein [Paenibacillus sp. FSL R7-269]